MEETPLFLTYCRWIKWDLDPQAKLNFDSPKRGWLWMTKTTLEFCGGVKPLGGNLRATAVTFLVAQLAGEFTFSLPLALINEITTQKQVYRILRKELEGVHLDILYHPGSSDFKIKKIMAFPHFGSQPESSQEAISNFFLAEEVKHLYHAEEEAYNWERILNFQIQNSR